MSTFIILTIAGFGVPSAPWQDLHDLSYTACPAFASAPKAVPTASAASIIEVTIVFIVCSLIMYSASTLWVTASREQAQGLENFGRFFLHRQNVVTGVAILRNGFFGGSGMLLVMAAETAGRIRMA